MSKTPLMPRFVVLIHDHPILHWDFMLEKEAALRTWRLNRPPGGPGSIAAEPLPDHRLAYLDYEGSVSGGRGTVRRFDWGEYSLLEESDNSVVVELRGEVLMGRASINSDDEGWRFTFASATSSSNVNDEP
jgi:hypothetical protein